MNTSLCVLWAAAAVLSVVTAWDLCLLVKEVRAKNRPSDDGLVQTASEPKENGNG